jgi:rfaE bifunctional protein nucleotidyltransferase chain/domain
VTRHKVVSLGAAEAWAAQLRGAGQTVVFTNGVYDLLHPGHVRYLQDARRCGDALVVAVNADDSVRAIKGHGRPITPEEERAELVAALACVDRVLIFKEPDPHYVIGRIQPDVLVKGADWPADRIIGRDIVEAHGGRVVRIPLAEGYSSSAIIKKIQGS